MLRTPSIVLLPVLVCAGGLTAAISQPVMVEGGAVQGVLGRNAAVASFKAIPFASPPIGNLRWREPQPVASWTGVRNAAAFSPSCVQTIHRELKPWTYEFMTHNQISEDCLYLNVWTPAQSASAKLPVYVYVYGGAFNSGSGAVPIYDGEALAGKGIVVVTFNYRVGAFGFLALPELTRESPRHASGNYGLLDQVAALRWVQANIGRFGGDPQRVTVGGQSAGSISVHDLTASPLAKGLFKGAIMESGGSTVGHMGINIGPRTLAAAEADGEKFMHEKGAANLAQLRAVSWQELAKTDPGFRFLPIVDGYLLTEAVPAIFAQGRENDVVSLTGVNAGELRGFTGPQPVPATVDAYRQEAASRYGDRAEEFLNLYPAATAAAILPAEQESARDGNLAAVYLWAQLRAKTARTPVYEYLWTHVLPGPDAALFGAFHSSELPYVFDTLNMADRPFTPEDRHIAGVMSTYWANFIRHGDPNGNGVPYWPPVRADGIMELGDHFKPIPITASPAKLKFWTSFLLRDSEKR